MEDQIPFKVSTYWNETDKPEVRRFAIEKYVVANFHHLTKKLEDFYPRLQGNTYSVFWKDEEGDDVLISSVDEMLIALGAMQGLVKLFIYCKEEEPETLKYEPVITAVGNSGNACGNGDTKHFGVICDGCDTQVVGFRYKCTACDDYDLCSKCEASGVHPEHCMVRIPTPIMPNTVIRAAIKRSRHFLKSVATAIDEEHCKKQRRERSHERKWRGDSRGRQTHRGSQGHHPGSEGGHQHGRQHVSWLEIFNSYLNEFANLAGDVDCATKKQSEAKTEKQPEAKTETPKNSTENNTQTTQAVASSTSNQKKQYLIDPDIISVWNSYLQNHSSSKPSTSSNVKKSDDVEMSQEDRKTSDADKTKVKSVASPSVEATKEDSPDKEGWTVINKEKDLLDVFGRASAPAEISTPIGFNLPKEFQERVKISDGQNLYPALNIATAEPEPVPSTAQSTAAAAPQLESTSKTEPTPDKPAPAEPTPRQPHPKAHIESALQNMVAMGFSDDGGWLAQLLESKDGNIAAVLDLLTPVKTHK